MRLRVGSGHWVAVSRIALVGLIGSAAAACSADSMRFVGEPVLQSLRRQRARGAPVRRPRLRPSFAVLCGGSDADRFRAGSGRCRPVQAQPLSQPDPHRLRTAPAPHRAAAAPMPARDQRRRSAAQGLQRSSSTTSRRSPATPATPGRCVRARPARPRPAWPTHGAGARPRPLRLKPAKPAADAGRHPPTG